MSTTPIKSRIVDMYCPDEERNEMDIKVELSYWVGQRHSIVVYRTIFATREKVARYVKYIGINMMEQMVRMGKNRWLILIDSLFANLSLMSFFTEIIGVALPPAVKTELFISRIKKSAVMYFSNSQQLLSDFMKIKNCPCDKSISCASCKSLLAMNPLLLGKTDTDEENPCDVAT